MAHKALYRTWRPQLFGDVVGQQHIIRTLQNSLKESRLSHAYLFNGPRGTGKTTIAKLLAKAVNCRQGPGEEPCNTCPSCLAITEGSEIGVLEIDAASNRGIDEIRNLRDKMIFAYTEVRHKVYIIDEVHMLTTEAFNALLKTLEEPPPNVMFILATTEPHRIPATIISRCQRFDFRRIPLEEEVGRLLEVCREEGVDLQVEAAQYIARLSEGGMRDALSLLDQIISFTGNAISYDDAVAMTGGIAGERFAELAAHIREGDSGQALTWISQLMQEGKSADRCMENLLLYFRDILMIKMVPGSQTVTERVLDIPRFKAMAETFSADRLFAIMEVLNHFQNEMKYSTQPQTLFEVAVLKLCTLASAGEASTRQADLQAAASSAGAAGTVGSVGQEELQLLKRRIGQLEEQLAGLLRNPPAAASPQPAANRAPGQAPGGRASAPAVRRSTIKLDGFVKEGQSPFFKQAAAKWSQVLSGVKETRITVHAWLVDGEPVACQDDQVLVAFKSPMHRETTEKPANKQVIEQVLTQVLGQPARLATVMMNEWKEAQSSGAGQAQPEELKLEEEASQPAEGEWVQEAVKLFGEDLVRIRED
jgi:DNA polymerase III subunit gamma/tau